MLQDDRISPKFAQRFVIKAGGLVKAGEGTRPEKWDHFKICYPDRNELGNPIPAEDWMKHHLGTTEPKEVPFMFFSNNPEDCYDDGYGYYTRNRRLCSSRDGKIAYWLLKKLDPDGKEIENPFPVGIQPNTKAKTISPGHLPVYCRGQECPMQMAGKCKLNLRLSGFIPKPAGEFGGADIFYSSSWHSAKQLRASLQMLISITGGAIQFIPLILRLQPKRVMTKGRKQSVFVASFFPSIPIAEVGKIVAVRGGENLVALPADLPSIEEEEMPGEIHTGDADEGDVFEGQEQPDFYPDEEEGKEAEEGEVSPPGEPEVELSDVEQLRVKIRELGEVLGYSNQKITALCRTEKLEDLEATRLKLYREHNARLAKEDPSDLSQVLEPENEGEDPPKEERNGDLPW